MTVQVTYERGGWAAVATDHELVQRCWSLLAADAGPDDVLDALVTGGVRAAPSFAMVSRTPGGRRVVVHGDAQVVVAGGNTVTAGSARGWVDDDLSREVALILCSPESVGTEPSPAAPIPPGVTSAASITVPADDSHDADSEPDDRVSAVDETVDLSARGVTSVSETVDLRAGTADSANGDVDSANETIDLDSPWARALTVSIPRPESEEETVDFSAVPPTNPPMFQTPVARVAGPSVIAGYCPVGHLSPPHVPGCRICGLPMAAQQGFEVARPILGRLRLSTGDEVILDRGVLFGRAPEIPDGVVERPNVVRLPSPDYDISRTHAVVTLDGWFVHVTDLGSTNGTSVTMPGQQAVRLRPHAEHLLAPHAVVGLADEITFTFEVVW